jgi:hypothetical protein
VHTADVNVTNGYRIFSILSVDPQGDFATSVVCDGIGRTLGWFTFMSDKLISEPNFEAVCLQHQSRKVRAILCEKISTLEAASTVEGDGDADADEDATLGGGDVHVELAPAAPAAVAVAIQAAAAAAAAAAAGAAATTATAS